MTECMRLDVLLQKVYETHDQNSLIRRASHGQECGSDLCQFRGPFRNHWFLCRQRKTRLNVNYTAVCPYMILCYSLSNHQRLLAATCQHSSLLCQQLLFLRLFAVLFPLRTSFLTKITAFKSKEMSQINRTIVFFI